MNKLLSIFSTLLIVFVFSSCGDVSQVEILRKELNKYPEYSIILEDMKEEGNFFTDYYHKYKIVFADKAAENDSLVYHTNVSDWQRVKEKEFKKYAPYLGMVLVSKSAASQHAFSNSHTSSCSALHSWVCAVKGKIKAMVITKIPTHFISNLL